MLFSQRNARKKQNVYFLRLTNSKFGSIVRCICLLNSACFFAKLLQSNQNDEALGESMIIQVSFICRKNKTQRTPEKVCFQSF